MSPQPFRDAPLVEPMVTLAVRRGMSPLRLVIAVAAGITLYLNAQPRSLPLALIAGAMIIAWGRLVRLEVKLDAANRELHVDSSVLGAFRKRTTTDLAPYTSAEEDGSALSDRKRRSSWQNKGDWVIMLLTPEGERHLLERWAGPLPDTRALVRQIDDALHPQREVLGLPTGAPTAIVSCRLGFEYGFMGLLVGSTATFVGFAMWNGAPPICLVAFVMLPYILVRAFPRRELLIYADDGQVAVVTSLFGFFPETQRIGLARIQRAIVDQKDASSGAALLLDDGHHVPLTIYSNASFGVGGFVARVNAALGRREVA